MYAIRSYYAEFWSLKAELKFLNLNPEKITAENINGSVYVYAPISGNINELNIAVGQFVSSDDVLFELINNNDFYLELNVFERDIHKIEIGQKVKYSCSVKESIV